LSRIRGESFVNAIEDSGQFPASPKKVHLDRRNRAAMVARNLGDRAVLLVEEVKQTALSRAQKLHCLMKRFRPPALVDYLFEGRGLGNQALIDEVDVLRRTSPAPVIVDGIPDDLRQEGSRILDHSIFTKSLYGSQGGFLFEIFVMHGRAGLFRNGSDDRANLRRREVHVTFLR
jgi:hypothetical protein